MEQPTPRFFVLSAKRRDRASEFFADVAKLAVGSIFIPFFVPSGEARLDWTTAAVGLFIALFFFALSLRLLPHSEI